MSNPARDAKCVSRPLELGRATEPVRTEREGTSDLDGRPTRRAPLRHDEEGRASASRFRHHLHDLGDHVAGALYPDEIPLPHVAPIDLLPVVQGRPGDRDAAHLHREQEGDGRQDARAADLYRDPLDARHLRPGLELEGDRPPGVVGGRPQVRALVEIVQLHNDPVDLVVEGVAIALEGGVILKDLFHAAGGPDPLGRRKPPLVERADQFQVRSKAGPSDLEDVVGEQLERPTRRDRRVELPEGARGGVPGVGVRLFPGLQPFLVQALER